MNDVYAVNKKPSTSTDELRQKLGIIPTNVWDSSRARWRVERSKWNDMIELAGEIAGVQNPAYATREGCWLNNGGMAKSITGTAINGGASVLDSFVCELLLKLFIPQIGGKIYNPFGGGVQMGFVAGFYGYEYLATEIRQNQVDANNAICGAMQMEKIRWIVADSSKWESEQKFDMIFTCPPYYLVEDYRDYNDVIPENELNHLPTYVAFRSSLFSGYEKSLKMLNENRFFIIMIGDSRNPKTGGYYGAEAETELWMRDNGLHIWNRITYLEPVFTRAIQSPRMMKMRKIPKVEQKIIIAYKGNPANIPNQFESLTDV